VISPAELRAAELGDQQSTALRAVLGVCLVEHDHAVGDALHLEVVVPRRAIVQHQHGATAAREVLLECEHLAAIAQRGARQQADLRERVEHQPLRLEAFDLLQDQLGGFRQLHLGRVEYGVVLPALQRVGARQHLVDVHAVERPPMGGRDRVQLRSRLGQAHVQHDVPAARAFHEELQRERGLARSGQPLDQVELIRGEPTAEDVVQSLDSGAGT
jgi:hypothetical protein